jgi:Inverse autotransporter, beta-domain
LDLLSPPLLPPLDSGLVSLSDRRIPQATDKRLGDLVLFKPTLSSGAIYRFGDDDRGSRLTMDFFLPTRMGRSSSFFVESRAEYRDPFAHLPASGSRRLDLDLGLGWRKVGHDGAMVGINTFWDTSRLSGDWYASAGFGLEAALPVYSGLWDISLNADRGGGIDLKSGYTLPVWNDRLDMRVYAEKYRFFDGEFILGSKFGAELSSPDRLLSVSYEYGQDSRNPEYQVIACSVAVPLKLDNIFRGKNPFSYPDQADWSHHYAQRLKSEGVRRAWHQPDAVVEARNTPQGKRWSTPGELRPLPPRTYEVPKNDSETSTQPSDWDYDKTGSADKTKSLGDQLLYGVTKIVLDATWACCDYAYRNAFGPFKIEPYEKARIKKEMSSIRRRK